ncbi:hypothetical protein CDAR_518001 [Caerostris darwini]|uniref:Uncharacterized protein n=1 Tax=Caerostris darwini TaxID=1538125 RepID=A0AAV4QUU3_9ARAC|nr:hypothetical protein CDAR_518001 [Caerostris darwini]
MAAFSVDLQGRNFIYSWLLCFYIYFNTDFRGLRNDADDRKRGKFLLDAGEGGGGDGFLLGFGSAFFLGIGLEKGIKQVMIGKGGAQAVICLLHLRFYREISDCAYGMEPEKVVG